MSFDLPDLPNGWSFASLESCSQKGSITYGIVQPGTQTDDGVPIIRVNNFRDTRIDVSEVMKVTPEIAAKYERTRLKGGEVLLTVVGTVGQVAVAPPSVAGYNVARAVAVIHPLPHVSAEWISLCLRSPFSQHLLGSRANTTVQTTINLKDLRALPIPLPPESERIAITEMVCTLDDRITLLRETNATLEAIAQALFKSWFVDFDPVHAKMQGRVPEGMDEATAALFPDSFEDSELGPVPKGWSTSYVADVASIVKGKSYSSKDLVEVNATALVTLKSFERGGGFRMDGFKPYSGAFKTTQVVASGDLIVAYTDVTQAAELIGKPAIVVGVEEYETLVASLDVGIVRPDFSLCSRQFLYGLFKTDSFQSHTLAHTSGTTVLHLSKDGVGSYQFTLPPIELITVFEVIAAGIAERRQTNSDLVRTLSSLRNTLLPRLISGQLRIEDAKEARA